jgi:hypothetical protein
VAAVGLLALTVLAAGLVQGGAAAALRHSVDASARPLYDLLVTAPDAGAAPTVLPPNSLGAGGEPLRIEDVLALRALTDVEVAAPIAQLLLPIQQGWRLQLTAAVHPEQLTPAGESYRATLRLLSDDGLGERLLSEEKYMVALDQSNAPLELPAAEDPLDTTGMCNIGDVPIDCSLYDYDWGFDRRTAAWVQGGNEGTVASGQSDGSTVTVSLPQSFALDQRMTLVDPVAEQALLGDAGAFLAPLVELGEPDGLSTAQLGAWGSEGAGPYARALTTMAEQELAYRQEMEQSPAYQEYLRVKRERGEEPDPADYFGSVRLSSPILVAEEPALPPLRAELTIESFGPIELSGADGYGPPTFPAPLLNGDTGTPVATVDHDVSALLDAFSYYSVPLGWPGTSTTGITENAEFTPGFLGFVGAMLVDEIRPGAVGQSADGDRTVRVGGVGSRTIVPPSGGSSGLSTRADPAVPGVETAYSAPRKADGGPLGSELDNGTTVGSFSAADLRAILATAEGIPLGAYEPADAVLVEGADGEKLSPTPITSSLTALGLRGAQTNIIGDIRGAGWQDDAIIDAIRVRVAGVERYDGVGIAAVSAAAREIEELGYTARLVAGSHSETVRLSVDDYAFGTRDAAAEQRVGELGVVEQRWTVLGQAAAFTSAVGTGMMLLLNTVLLAVLGLVALTEFGAIPARRRDAATLRGLGWNRSRIARWFAGEQLIGLLLVTGAGAIALLAAPEPALAAPFVAAGLIGTALICVITTVRATRPSGARAVSGEALDRALGAEYRPEARVVGGEPDGSDASGRAAASAPHAQRRLPGSAVSWGIQRAWRRPAAALPMAFAVLTAMATVAAFALAMAEMSGQNAPAPLGAQFAAAAPQLLLALCGVGVAGVLVVRSRGQSAREGHRLRAVLQATGWPNAERRRARLSASLAVTLASVLCGSYLLWFALGALGVTAENAIVSAALVAGIVVAALILVPLPAWRGASRFTRKAVAPDGDAA